MLHEQIFKSYKLIDSAISQMKNILNFCLKIIISYWHRMHVSTSVQNLGRKTKGFKKINVFTLTLLKRIYFKSSKDRTSNFHPRLFFPFWNLARQIKKIQ